MNLSFYSNRIRRRRAAAFGLIEILVVMVIILILALILLPRLTRSSKDPKTGQVVLAPKQRAQQVAGSTYIAQINQAITMYKMDNDNQNPPTLQEIKRYGVTDAMLVDPVTRQSLAYDPQTGQVGAGSTGATFSNGGGNGIDNLPGSGGTSSLPNVSALPGNANGGSGIGGGTAGLNL